MMPPEQNNTQHRPNGRIEADNANGHTPIPPAITTLEQAPADSAHPTPKPETPSLTTTPAQGQIIQSGSFQATDSFVSPVAGDTSGLHTRTRRKLWLGAGGLLIIIILAAGGWFLTQKKTSTYSTSSAKKVLPTSTAIQIPTDWKTVDTGMGFSVRAPNNWLVDPIGNSDRDGKHSQTTVIGLLAGDPTESEASQEQQDQSIFVSSETIDGITTESAFNQKVIAMANEGKSSAQALGIDPNTVKINSKTVKVNGKPWLEVTSSIIYAINIYSWQGDHAITLAVGGQSQAELQELSKDYLYPMAASISIN